MFTGVCETIQTSRWTGLRTAKRSPVSDTIMHGMGLKCTLMMTSCGQTPINYQSGHHKWVGEQFVNIQSLNPYVCKNKHYLVGHHR